MPPKRLIPDLFKDSKLTIVPFDKNDDCERMDLNFSDADEVFSLNNAIIITEECPTAKVINKCGSIALNLKVKINRRKLRILRKMFFLKPRKLTYKTLRHDCAKRNGRR